MKCVYCGENEATTEDHVVPEGLFDHAPGGGYVKVPSCYDCNNGYSRDEEYFLVAVLAEATMHSPVANRVLDRLAEDHRSGRRKRSGLAVALLQKVRPVDVYSPGGVYIGSGQGVEIDTARVNRVLEKIVRGLFFHRFKRPLPQRAPVFVEIKPDMARLHSGACSAALQQPPTFMDDVFSYRVFVLPENGDYSSWTFGFYDSVLAIAVTGAPQPTPEVM
jgi:hypothetical protein